MNALAKWLKDHGITRAEFGDRIGKHRSTITRIIDGSVPVDRETAQRIFDETRGAITPNLLYDIPPSSSRPASVAPAADRLREAG